MLPIHSAPCPQLFCEPHCCGGGGGEETGCRRGWPNGRLNGHARVIEGDVEHLLTEGGQGLGIALVAAQRAKIPVTLVDTSQASIDKGLKFAGSRGTGLDPCG